MLLDTSRIIVLGLDIVRKMSGASGFSEAVQFWPSVQGLQERKNAVFGLTRDKTTLSPGHAVIVYFGGDVQDGREKMLAHRDNHVWAEKRSLEATVSLLGSKYPNAAAIFAIRPVEMYVGTFSVFKNFVPSNGIGVPDYNPDHGAWDHLAALLAALSELVDRDFLHCPVSLIGFSKGCVVLNQLFVESAELSNAVPLKVDKIIFLDGGHAGQKGCWIKDNEIIENATKSLQTAKFSIQVTPYQVQDNMRPWKGKEEKAFHKLLMKHCAGDRVERVLHFDGAERSLDMHFNILDSFNP